MSRKIILCIAMSLDGFIADKSGDTDWIEDCETGNVDSINREFLNKIDTAIMGRKTYDKITSEVSPEDWAQKDVKYYVFTSQKFKKNDYVEFVNEDIYKFIRKLKSEYGKNIWVVGGATLIQELILNNLIDEFYITISPIILGEGILLFKDKNYKTKLHLDKCKAYGEMVLLKYSRL